MNDDLHGSVNDKEPAVPVEYEELPVPEEYEELPVPVEDEELPVLVEDEELPVLVEDEELPVLVEDEELPRPVKHEGSHRPIKHERSPRPVKREGSPRPIKQEESPRPVISQPPRKARGKGRKVLLVTLGALVVLLGASWMLNQPIGQKALNTTGLGNHQAAPTASLPTPTPALPTPIVKVRGTPVGPNTLAAGALILLNPGVVRQGTNMGVNGSGFDPRAIVDLAIKQHKSGPGQIIGFARTDKYGNFYENLMVPNTMSSGTFFIEARERGSTNVAQAAGVIAGGAPQLKLGAQVGKPGDMVTVTVHGFSPDEKINVYWNTMSGDPVATLQADGGGSIGQAPVQVPYGAAGVNTFLFVGAKSQSMVAATFYLLSLYPSIKLSSYAIRADHQMTFSGVGFGPGERVLVFLNTAIGQPVAVIQTTQHGTFANAGGLVVPFGLKGKQSLIFMGEESRASVSVNWQVLPYMPSAQASTYGGLPGTTVSFYAAGFARQEVVYVYVGHTHDQRGNMVSCFLTNDKGSVAAAGSYVIPGDAQGKLTFTLVGSKSGGTTTAAMNIQAPPAPVQVPAQPPFTCPLNPTS